ncbi:hypothetical protein THAOC_20294 [Thalassiosira oceanica]|uniref:Ornithine cyclodeaminase n=1 Tax=Thalassiosira oceanica TaxID=159749 RepID=K0S2K3_THAOC|nr:hypothetical protein THAOC_20294 [Thalassiosira oceanica]|eukprot:EJK59480.1 hypothetical protein THAOC_20294 [Thalassiosira oceanica]
MSESRPPIKIYTLEEIEEVASSSTFAVSLVDAIQSGFAAFSRGEFNAGVIQTLGAPPMAPFVADCPNYAAQTCVKSGYITGSEYYVIKVASGGNPHENSGLVQLYSQRTGKLAVLLLDDGLLTEIRTAAAGALAAKMFAPTLKATDSVGMLGSGIQARFQLRYLAHVTDCRNVLVWGRTEEKVNKYKRDMEAEGWQVQTTNDPQRLLRCPLIVTTTSAREPILKLDGDTERLNCHINCIGADATGKMELDPMLVAASDLLVADSKKQTRERGEFEEAISRGLVSLDQVVEIGNVNTDGEASSSPSKRFSIFDTSGVAVQDCVVAEMVMKALATNATG